MKKIISLFFTLVTLSFVFISCGGNENDDDNIGEGITTISLVSDKLNIVLNENEEEQDFFTFKATNNSGVDVSEFCTFYVNEQELESNIFIPNELGSYQIIAKYDNYESNAVIVNVIDTPSTYYKHKVLIEDFTGTWCGWCTRIIYAIELLENQTHDIIPVAIHNNDEFDFAGRMPLEDYLMIEGAYPFASINRKKIWMNPQHQKLNQALGEIKPFSPIGIKLKSTLGNSSGTVDLSFSFKENIPGQLKYAIYIVENGLIANQKNYNNDLYGGVSTLYNFTHNHTLRGVYSNIIGNDLGQSATENSEVTFSNLTINYSCENSNNLQVVAFIMDAQGNVLNVQIANGNTEKDYEIAQ